MSHSYHQLVDGKIFMGSADDTQDVVDREEVSVVVDLRGEATKPAAKGDFEWIQVPLGDNAPNAESALYREAIDAVVKAMHDNQKVYFHCGMGRGRTGTVAAGVLLELGYATDVDDAAAKAKLIRPEISIQPVQKQALEQIFGAQL
ncbi:MAG: dual specificity protein phosphatase family protein [Actinomycetales bacterium]|nr:dual specificity protein phosphatase family protein [Actinomycetales bacterium]